MAKVKQVYTCRSCGAEFSKWHGKCPSCEEWNTLGEAEAHSGKARAVKPDMVLLSSISFNELKRIQTGIGEFNLVCGSGIVPGSLILIGGEPGIGKSTLALQIAHYFRTLYISGEESPIQLRHRTERLRIDASGIHISTGTDVNGITHLMRTEKPECVVIDSIQTLYSPEIPGLTGSVSQIRESAARLGECARACNIPVILIGHITKDGNIAGPKLLEHLVDTVLYFEGDFSRDFRVLRAFKNRFGSVNEVGLFRMTDRGLAEVTDKNKIFLNPFSSTASGNAISAALEGSRTILFEVQSLVSFTSFSNPRRMADGFDQNRLILITAVLEKHAGLKLNSFDVFVNVSGGFRINETAADLAVAMAITSSLKNCPVSEGTGLLGEISLSGEIRPVSQITRRVKEFSISGFTRLLVSSSDAAEAAAAGFSGEITGIKHISEAADILF